MAAHVRPLVVHVIFRLDVGGLENGLINLINQMPSDRYRHAIVCLTEATEFSRRLQKSDVEIVCLCKRPGMDWRSFLEFFRVLRRLRPTIVHTRNLAALEYVVPSMLAGVPGRIHGEHGRDTYDLHGKNWKYLMLRRFLNPLISAYTTVSLDLKGWLEKVVGVNPSRLHQIYNGVDITRFSPALSGRPAIGPSGFLSSESLVIGTVGRMLPVKDQLTLVHAFMLLLTHSPELRSYLRLVLIGEGPLRTQALALLEEADLQDVAWLPGERQDIPELLRGMDIFVLPSIGEGISNTILEGMATGLPVIATRVGGNEELVADGQTGRLVPPSDPKALAEAIREYLPPSVLRLQHGQAGRQRVERLFSLQAMVEGYLEVYDAVGKGRPEPAVS